MARGFALFALHLVLAGGGLFLATVVGAGMTGKSIAAGERTAMNLFIFDLVVYVLAIASFSFTARTFASGLARWVWSLAFAGTMTVGVAVLLLMTLVILNR